MPGTTPGGFPYPLPTEPVADGADQIKALAEKIDATFWSWSGTLQNPMTAATDWAISNTNRGSKLGRLAFIEVSFTRTGAALTSSSGDVANNTVGSFNAGWACVTGMLFPATAYDIRVAAFRLSGASIQIAAIVPGQTIATGDVVTCSGVYVLSTAS